MSRLWIEVTVGHIRITWTAMDLFYRCTKGLKQTLGAEI